MSERRDRWFALSITLWVLILITFPYLLAVWSAGDNFEFNGFLLNPQDGNSYLSKMFQGWDGSWRFQLPYTANPGEGAYLFLFYLFLGHLARILNIPLLTAFHTARILGTIFLLWSLWRFFGAWIPRGRSRRLAFALAALGSGMGWLLLPFGFFTSDFWVAETYPFLSAYANPHFPIGLALVLWLVAPHRNHTFRWTEALLLGLGSIALSVVNPFGVVIALMVMGGELLWRMVKKPWPRDLFYQVFTVGLCGLPLIVYDFWITIADPVFAGWNAQNLTLSPPLWELAISLSPVLWLAILAVVRLICSRKKGAEPDGPVPDWVPLVIWAGLGMILMYLPVGLQRRFMMGLYIPLAGLSALGLEAFTREKPQRYITSLAALFLLALPTNLVILLAAFQGIRTHDPQIYLTRGERMALNWIAQNTDPDSLILSSPEMGSFIPAYSGRRVIYGHPYETVDAEGQKQAVTQFFAGDIPKTQIQDFLADYAVEIIFYGDREQALGGIMVPAEWQVVFQASDVTLYRVDEP